MPSPFPAGGPETPLRALIVLAKALSVGGQRRRLGPRPTRVVTVATGTNRLLIPPRDALRQHSRCVVGGVAGARRQLFLQRSPGKDPTNGPNPVLLFHERAAHRAQRAAQRSARDNHPARTGGHSEVVSARHAPSDGAGADDRQHDAATLRPRCRCQLCKHLSSPCRLSPHQFVIGAIGHTFRTICCAGGMRARLPTPEEAPRAAIPDRPCRRPTACWTPGARRRTACVLPIFRVNYSGTLGYLHWGALTDGCKH